MKKRLLPLLIFPILLLFALQLWRSTRVIGHIEGAEWQRVSIGDTAYHSTFDSGVTISRRGRFLGILTDQDGGVRFRAYTVKDDPQGP